MADTVSVTQAIAKATWCGDSDILDPGAAVDVLAVDLAGRLSRRHGVSGVPARVSAWIRYWPEHWDFAQYRSCDLADLDLSDEDFDRLASTQPAPIEAPENGETDPEWRAIRRAIDQFVGRVPTISKHRAVTNAHIAAVVERLDAAGDREAADTIVWQCWWRALDRERERFLMQDAQEGASTQPAPAFPREEVAKLIENIRAAVTYQYMPMSVRMLLSQAVSALSTISPSAPNTPAPTEATESECLREALARMVYETTHLSPCKPNGDHECTIKADALAMARAALLQGKQP